MANPQTHRGRDDSHEWSGNPYCLTAREQLIATLVAEDISTEQAASLLNMTVGVFRAALARLLRKTGAHNLTHLNHILATLDRVSDQNSDQDYSQADQLPVRPALILSERLVA